MNLKLLKPLAFIDIESTGLNKETDRIVELAITIIHPDGNETSRTRRFNPGIPIPPSSTEIHGIKDEDVVDEPTFRACAHSLMSLIVGCDIAGFGSNYFDVPLLYNEFRRSGIVWEYSKVNFIDVGNLFKIQEPRDLSAAVKFYTGNDHSNAHTAFADVTGTIAVFKAQLKKYELPKTVKELSIYTNYGKPILDLSGKFTHNEAGEIVFNFGPHRGIKASNEPSFIEWMISKDFPPDTVEICYKILNESYAGNDDDESEM